MRVLVTGATGFLGSTLCEELRRRGHEVDAVSSRVADLRDPTALSAFATGRYDRVFHLAAWTQAGDFCLRHPGEQWLINQKINTNVLAWWQSEQPDAKMLAIGTSCAYDEHLPHAEENYLVGKPTPSLFTYAMTKRMMFAGLLALHQQFGLRYLHVVPSTLYGPGYHEDGRQMHFIFDLMRKILAAKHRGDRVELWGDGNQRRELVYLPDFVAALLQLDERAENTTVNIGAGADHTIREFAERICAIVGYPAARIEYDVTRYVGARAKRLEVAKLRSLLPEARWTTLADGLKSTLDWMEPRTEMYLR